MFKIILATSSPYRKEAFGYLGLDFVAEGSDVKEDFEGRPDNPEELVLHLAQLKAESVAEKHSEGIVIGFDSVGWYDGRVFEKPRSREEAFQMLQNLSGNTHLFYTGIHMINLSTDQTISKIVKTEVKMRELTDSEISKYLDQDQNYTTYALGYDPQKHFSSSFIESISGSYNNVIRGIPLEAIVKMLSELGYKI